LDFTRFTSTTSNTFTRSELEAFGATFALRFSWTGASLARSVASFAGLDLDVNDVSIVILNLSFCRSFIFVHTPTAGGAFAFILAALLTIRLTFVANVHFLVMVESHSLLVSWAFSEAHTDQLSDLLGFSFSGLSASLIGFSESATTSFVPDLVHGLIVGHISGFLVRFFSTFGINSIEFSLLFGSDGLSGEDSYNGGSLHGSDHFEVHVHEFNTTRWLVDLIEHLHGIFVLNTHGFLVGGENGVTFAGEAASLGTVDTISAREVASFAPSGIFFSVHTWFTDSTLGCVLTDSAFDISTSFTLGGCSIPEGSWGAHRAFASFLAEETSFWASFTVTVVANVMFGVTDDTVVGFGWNKTNLVNDLSRLTVGHVDSNISADLLASQSVLGKAPCLLTGETLGLGTDGAIGSHVSADFAGHSLGESSGSGRDHRFTSITFVTSSVLIAFTTSGAANGGMGADFAHCGTRCRCRVFKMGGFASFAYVSWAEATVCRSTSSALNTFWSVTCGGSDLEVFTSRTLEASVHTQDVIDLTLHATSNTSTLCISSSCTTGKGDSLGIGIDELLETCSNL
jgi:hypothetical protein